MVDTAERLVDAVRQAHASGQALRVAGSGSKGVPADPALALLSIEEHAGIETYRPEELVVTARAGTPIRELVGVLARNEQILGFDPPWLRGSGTIGGAVASGFSGPSAPWWGRLRDAVLGVEMINGLGEHLRFGGQVIKNVAGYDVSRLAAGSWGTLGVLLSVSLRVQPRPRVERTYRLPADGAAALSSMRQWARRPLPLSATAHVGDALMWRLSGNESVVRWAERQLGGEPADGAVWSLLRDRTHPFFSGGAPSCFATPAATEAVPDMLIEWSGQRRWYLGDDAPAVGAAMGATLVPLSGLANGASVGALQQRIKAAFDPANILNPDLGPGAVAN